MSADLSHVPTEGMQRDDVRRVLLAAERAQEAFVEREAHGETMRAVAATGGDEAVRTWCMERELLTGAVLGRLQSLLRCIHDAQKSGALGAFDLDTEHLLRIDHADVGVAP